MPDKEFDKLFKDKFADAEIEPSTNLWANIEKELEPVKKRTLPIYWMAAAVIALAFSAMLIFQKKEVIKLEGSAQTAVSKQEAADTIATPDQSVNPASIAPVQKQLAKNPIVSPKKQAKEEVTPAINLIEQNEQKNQLAVQPNTTNDRLPIKQQDPKPIDVLPIKEAQVEEKAIAYNPSKEKIEDNTIPEVATPERKGIRNVGDLVNYVVDKVDKREKKLVRFNTDDDDNSSIVGINIGFLKFNKKNRDR